MIHPLTETQTSCYVMISSADVFHGQLRLVFEVVQPHLSRPSDSLKDWLSRACHIFYLSCSLCKISSKFGQGISFRMLLALVLCLHSKSSNHNRRSL